MRAIAIPFVVLGLGFGLSGAVLAPLSSAEAATVAVVDRALFQSKAADRPYRLLQYASAPGEADDVTFTAGPLGITVRADGVEPLEVGAGCVDQQLDGRTLLCAGASALTIAAGDGDDHVVITGPLRSLLLAGVVIDASDGDDVVDASGLRGTQLEAHGGAGDDVLRAGAEHAGLDGGGGRDELHGGPSFDELDDGDRTGAADRDVLDGGGGVDVVSYRSRFAPVDVDLMRPDGNGERGEDDRVEHAEGIYGGSGSDVLRGTAGADLIEASSRAVVRARGGDDFVRGGRDVDGGPGDDELWAPGVRGACGSGRDSVTFHSADSPAVLSGDCERIGDGGPRLEVHDRRISLRLAAHDCPCVARLTLRVAPMFLIESPMGGTLIGRARGRLVRGRPRLAVSLSPRGRRLLRRYPRLVVRADGQVTIGGFPDGNVGANIRLTAR